MDNIFVLFWFLPKADHLSRKKDCSLHFQGDEDNNQNEIKNNTKQQETS